MAEERTSKKSNYGLTSKKQIWQKKFQTSFGIVNLY
jgi:hypothetical protein